MSLFHVIIERTADPSPAHQATVARALAQRYQLPEADALRLLASGQRFRVRANTDATQGARMITELAAMGVVAALAPASGRANTPLPPGAPPPPAPPPARPAPPAAKTEARTMMGFGMPSSVPGGALPPRVPTPPVAAPRRQAPAPAPQGASPSPGLAPVLVPAPAPVPAPGPVPVPAPPAAAPSPVPGATSAGFESGLGAGGNVAAPAQSFGLAAAGAHVAAAVQGGSGLSAASGAMPAAAPPPPAGLASTRAPAPDHAFSVAASATGGADASFDRLGETGGLMLAALDGTDDEAAEGGPKDQITGRSADELARMFLPPDAVDGGGELDLDAVAPPPQSATLATAAPQAPVNPADETTAPMHPAPERAATPTATLAPSAAASSFANLGASDAQILAAQRKPTPRELVTRFVRERAGQPIPLFGVGVVLALLVGYLAVASYATGAEEAKFRPVVSEISRAQGGTLTLSEWKDLPAARSQAVERLGRAQTHIAVVSALLWGLIAGGVLYAWTRFAIPTLVRRLDGLRGGG